MSLDKYNQKRDFKQTKEPKRKIDQSENELLFVVQKHAASHLHYDFRLELNGVLVSWAVPKGPSMNPEIKRLAMMVEDHPYSYKDFEGNIPAGNYGAGNVIVWDNGTYTAADNTTSPEKTLKENLKKGRLSFILKGKKLKGEFSLVKLKGKQENAWLLIKKNDKYASETDILLKNKSVISKKTLEDLEKKAEKTSTAAPEKKKPSKAAVKSKAAVFIKPMLAASTEKPFDDEDWVFENKYDGYRTIAVINSDEINLWSRNQLSFNENFETLIPELKKIEHTVVLDGEVVVENNEGKASFQLLQNYLKTGTGNLKYYVFDILNLDGNSTLKLNLLERKELLKILLDKHKLSHVFYSEHTAGNGIKEFERAIKNKIEGIIAKKADSIYLSGKRSNDWLKIKIVQQEEAIIIGLTEPKKSRKNFGALLLGQYKGKKLQFIGKCGTGFSDATLKELYETLQPYFTTEAVITENIALRDSIQWVEPKLVCQVKFTEWTDDLHLRHPVYLGLRTDKNASEVLLSTKSKTVTTDKKKMNKAEEAAETKKDYDLKIGKIKLHLTNQHKIYFPEDGITKGDIVQYYNEVANFILPYLKNRPQSMNRFPNGINASGFYQKDVDTDKIPSWLKTEKVYSESNDKHLDYLICNNKQTLLYMANLGCIDINPWNSTIKKPENPDWLVIDIDPAQHKFEEVVKTALAVKEVMDGLESDCYCKTSGATGLHVYIPLGAKYDYEQIKILAELLAIEIHKQLPDITSLERTIKKRNHKIYIDYLQNRRGQTLAAPYSVRPVKGAWISTPLEWKEVDAKLHPSQFTIKNILKRLEKKGDLWRPVLGKGINIKKILTLLENRKKD
ncbi:DNA ligase D [Flavobacterium sp. ARAG 55.4]|uniref:DNA ligase D n=1 Tax=Flavobacterium sp. ARAG 55.4 TaxID=3451357 RepID=UPI003F477A9D